VKTKQSDKTTRRNAMRRRSLLAGAAALAVSAAFAPVFAQGWQPTQPIELVVHGGPGSGNDVMARQLVTIIEQEKLTPVRIQVANKVGGGSTTASAYMAGKKGDPNTIAIFTIVWVVDPLTQESANNRINDLTPITRVIEEPALAAVRKDSPMNSMTDFVKAAKEKPGQLKQSGGSITSRENILRQLIMKSTGANWVFIPFPGGGERIAALLGGNADMMIMDPSEAIEQVRAGKLKVLAQVGAARLDAFKDTPTMKEAGLDLPNIPQTRGIVGPPGMPKEAVAYYEGLMEKVRQTPGWKKFISDNLLLNVDEKSDATRAFLVNYENMLRDVLKDAGAKVVR
jgi:putative tricarboxylic transport membrane protein